MLATWFGHLAFRLDFDGTRVMTDPFFANGTDQDALKAAEGCTHVLLTHGLMITSSARLRSARPPTRNW